MAYVTKILMRGQKKFDFFKEVNNAYTADEFNLFLTDLDETTDSFKADIGISSENRIENILKDFYLTNQEKAVLLKYLIKKIISKIG